MADEKGSRRFTHCHAGCGRIVEYKFSKKVYCDDCRVARRREVYRRAAEKQRRKNGVPEVKGTKFNCARCGAECTRNRSLIAKYCSGCYRAINSAASPARSAAKRATESGREYHREWSRARRASDPSWRISAHMKTMMHRGLSGGKQGQSWREFVPYTLQELMDHIERQFLPGMTWENRTEWHIDHIVPLSSFSFTSPEDADFKAAWALTNLRPLWAKDNMRKSAKRTHLL